MNELALLFDRMGIDTLEVLKAAATKSNFLPFKPGLVGGHCIGVDPHYLAFKAKQLGYEPQVILFVIKVNEQMGVFVGEKVINLSARKFAGNITDKKLLRSHYTCFGASCQLKQLILKPTKQQVS